MTLLELLLVILLLGLIYGVTVPMLGGGVAGVELTSATRQVVAGLRKARNEAIRSRREALLSLDVDTKTFSVADDPRAYRLPQQVDISVFTAQSEIVGAQQGSVRFYPDGSSTGGRISLSIKSDKRHIDVDWLTGLATVQ